MKKQAPMPTDQQRLIVGPFNRVEGDLEVQLTLAGARVAAAQVVSRPVPAAAATVPIASRTAI